jgi:cytochrome c oxidase cbb3-type subunit 3
MSRNIEPSHSPSDAPIDVKDLRPHVYDGIQEYDKRMPNWWLWTFYGAIIFSIGYWIIVHMIGAGGDPGLALEQKMRDQKRLAVLNSPELTDAKLWEMSRDGRTVGRGKALYEASCASCHRPDLLGQIGPNLRDRQWIHGGTPLEVVRVINEGILAKGMPGWAPILGTAKVGEITAYILSYHSEGEPVEKVAGWSPPSGVAPPPQGSNGTP